MHYSKVIYLYIIFLDINTFKDSSENYKEMLEEEKNEKNTIVEKVKSLFSKIKNFEQLKYEVFEMRKIVEKTNEDISKIKEKYTNINDKMKDVNVFMNGSASFEHVQGDVEFRELTKKKLEDFDNKFKFVLGDFNFEGDEIIENVDKIKIIGKDKDKNKEEDKDKEKDKSIDKNNDKANEKNNDKDKVRDNYNANNTENEKNKNLKKDKLLNLVEINKKLIQYQRTKVNVKDFESKNEENKKKTNEINEKLNDVLKNLYGTNEIEKIDGFFKDKNILFASKSEFDQYKAQTDEELKKIYEKLENLNIQYEELFNKMKDQCTINDLDAMKNLILEKTEELFMNMKNKNIENTQIQILQKNFKKLVELLAEKEEKEIFLNSKKNAGGHTCASCEEYLGTLKDDSDRHIHWKKLPLKIKENENKFKLYKFGNGYSRFLRMINFDSNGNASLRPFDNVNEFFNNTSSNINEMAKSNNQNNSLDISNNITKENEKTSNNLLKSRNKFEKIENELPSIKVGNSNDNFDKTNKKMSSSTSSFKFMSPKITRNNKKKAYKYDL